MVGGTAGAAIALIGTPVAALAGGAAPSEAHRVGARLAGELIRHIEQAYPDDAARRDALLGSFERLDTVTRLHRGLSPWPGDAGPADWPPSSQ